jgi:hypothetical protein
MENTFPNRRWIIIPTSLTGSIDFSQVVQNSVDSLRISVDGNYTFVKYDIEIVEQSYNIHHIDADTGEDYTETIEAGVYGRPNIYSPEFTEYTYEEMLSILSGTEWSNTENVVYPS